MRLLMEILSSKSTLIANKFRQIMYIKKNMNQAL